MSEWSTLAASAPEPRLDERVLDLLSRSSGTLAFNGLRRALGAHPESLSRALRRLEREGTVRHEPKGYTLTVPGPDPGPGPQRLQGRTVANLQLPPGVERDTLFGALAGRWSGALRWVGVFDRPGDPWLAWSLDGTTGHVLLSVKKGALRILVDQPRSEPDGGALERAAGDLLLRVLERLRDLRPPTGSTATTFAMDASPVPFVDWWSAPSAVGVDMEGALRPSAS